MLTPKQARFVAEFLIDGNATQAAIRAGYSAKTARTQASALLTKRDIAQAVQDGRKSLERGAIADATERREILSAIAREKFTDPSDKAKAIDVLNKMDGVYVQKHEVGGVNGAPLSVVISPSDARL